MEAENFWSQYGLPPPHELSTPECNGECCKNWSLTYAGCDGCKCLCHIPTVKKEKEKEEKEN